MSYEKELLRLKTLLLAQSAIREAVQSAIEDVISAAAKESGRATTQSGTLRRFEPDAPPPPISIDPRSAEVEHLVMLAWTNARDDDERDRVRALVRESVSRRLLARDAEARLLSLAG